MGIFTKITDKIKEWLLNVTLKKGIKSLIKLIVSWLTAGVVAGWLATLGITVDPIQLQVGLTAAINSGLEMLRNWLKQKFGIGWL